MIIDLCHHSVGSKVKADKVSFDGYEVQNLVHSNPGLKCKGFLSDNFVKPPVNITVQFPCNISIYRVVINPAIGQQKSCDIKIFTATERVCNSWLYGNEKERFSIDGIRFNCVGHIYQSEPVTVCFDNPLFKERYGWTIDDAPMKESYPESTSMNSRRFGGLTDVSHVTVCVSRSKGAKSVAIKTLEIWGIPSAKVSQSIQQTLKSTYCRIKQAETSDTHKIPLDKQDSRSSDTESVLQRETLFERNGVEIPEDFIDQITCEIMTVPILLPCGKNVDQSTLERHVNSEASWGRSPSDPFTGVLFSKGLSPVTNTSLKARIDQFVFQHSDLLQVPQTLGHANRHKVNPTAGIVSKLVNVSQVNKNNVFTDGKGNVSSNAVTTKDKDLAENILSNVGEEFQLSAYRKRHKSVQNFGNKKRKIDQLVCPSSKEDSPPGLNYIPSSDSSGTSSTDHNTDLVSSLDIALMSTLSCLPSFTSSKKLDTSQDVSVKQCSKCASDLTMSNVIKYKLSCQHFVCRECLLKVRKGTSLLCGVCFTQSYPNDAVRVF